MVVGASAAGLLAGIFAGRAGAEVLLLETRPKPGAKIRVSGGGRCNLLPSEAVPEDFHTGGAARAMRNVLLSWPLPEVRAFFESELAIPLKVEDTGKVFPRSERPLDIVEALLSECSRLGVELRTSSRVSSVKTTRSGFEVALADADPIRADRVILATGGLSLPKTGSDGGGYRLARSLGHKLAPTFPVLVPLTTADRAWLALPGVSLPVTLRARREGSFVHERTGSFLFTHRGFSGPVVLDISRALTSAPANDVTLEAHWGGPTTDWPARLRTPGRVTVGSIVREALPRRLADLLLDRAGVPPESRLAELPRENRNILERELSACVLPIEGNEGYRTAEATGGGIPLDELRTKTLESRKNPGLHFAGEIIDVDGRIGGYNFLWAFVTGRRAGQAAARDLREPRMNG
ncbi:MAG: aminoacetone oxidase family FAD-binding enzyme [Candidatus Binatia bacterium]|nr:aminoacetone oxidase family FAD-binding enzyme [Candidatus Binatia bacterium]